MRFVTRGNAGAQFKRNMDAIAKEMAIAIAMTARKAGSEIRHEINKDIASAGHFGKPWQSSVKTEVDPKSGPALDLKATITTRYSSSPLGGMAKSFEEGAAIRGKPLLWIRLSFTGIHMRASKYARQFGLFFVERESGEAPLLLSKADRKPKYVGVEQVHLRKRFHLHEAAARVAKRIPAIYADMLAKVSKK